MIFKTSIYVDDRVLALKGNLSYRELFTQLLNRFTTDMEYRNAVLTNAEKRPNHFASMYLDVDLYTEVYKELKMHRAETFHLWIAAYELGGYIHA